MNNKIEIGAAESGQQILRFLERKIACPRSLVYRWLRSGEVRVNGGRVKADRILERGDLVRLPPQALRLMPGGAGSPLKICMVNQSSLGADLEIVFQNDDFLVLNKPYGLAVQGGSGHFDSVAHRLKEACSAGFYQPAPAHRLDLYASGLLVAGKSHESQTWLHGLFRESNNNLRRSYLCWVLGDASSLFAGETLQTDFLVQELGADGRERMRALPDAVEYTESCAEKKKAKEARSLFCCLEVRNHSEHGPVSLMSVQLLTGRKHQIRVQLASRGFPLLGDGRYGGKLGLPMMLHAGFLALPPYKNADNGLEFKQAPPWQGSFAVDISNVFKL